MGKPKMRSAAQLDRCHLRMPGTPAAMEPLEFIGIAAQATASALGAFGLWLVVAAVVSVPAGPSGLLIQNIATVLHPGVWYVLAALVARWIGQLVSK
ncbi:hypothetical protein [Methylobacterium sp. J-070]|uniref:hypothetical protein n=1 Tax=Methylobacterium sp. J-070 TaxID=2836650 RepID=UPI001FBBFCB7|nr:hypothetical protein [Methylobacterium sp. J-070]MCJ2051919.1 hypothetical protein [Methylobacterium sp. J-070]